MPGSCENNRKRVIDLVGDPAGHLPKGGKASRVPLTLRVFIWAFIKDPEGDWGVYQICQRTQPHAGTMGVGLQIMTDSQGTMHYLAAKYCFTRCAANSMNRSILGIFSRRGGDTNCTGMSPSSKSVRMVLKLPRRRWSTTKNLGTIPHPAPSAIKSRITK